MDGNRGDKPVLTAPVKVTQATPPSRTFREVFPEVPFLLPRVFRVSSVLLRSAEPMPNLLVPSRDLKIES